MYSNPKTDEFMEAAGGRVEGGYTHLSLWKLQLAGDFFIYVSFGKNSDLVTFVSVVENSARPLQPHSFAQES